MSISNYYNTTIKVRYDNNTEYRIAIRNVFNMDITKTYNDMKLSDIEDLDDETADEITYDETTMSDGLKYLYENTIENSLFFEIYILAAGKMLSVDADIGLAILLSYDYFQLFHACLVEYLNSPENFDDTNHSYISLRQKIG